jgi:hypothetical protein
MVQCLSEAAVNDIFIKNTPLLSSTIKDMTIQTPNWFRDVFQVLPWPEDEGTIMQETIIRGELPETEEGFDSWDLVDGSNTCEEVCLPDCSYNFHTLGGSAVETRVTRLMNKDFKSPSYCIKTLQSTRQVQMAFSQIIQNLYNQIDYQKEVNVGQNFLTTQLAKKLLWDSNGAQPNPEDPWTYRPKGDDTVLSALNLGMLIELYENMKSMTDVEPYMYKNGMPLFAMVGSSRLFRRLFLDDPTARADIRAVGGEEAKSLYTKYNFTDSIMDMFIAVPYQYPRRFRYDTTLNNWVRILPFVKGIPGVVGTFAGVNPDYHNPRIATHEEILFHGKDPFTVYTRSTMTTVGEGTDFGPPGGEPTFWDEFLWVNPQTTDDPLRRNGFFVTTAEIAISADQSRGVYGLMVPVAPVSTTVAFYQNGPTPPEAVSVTNVVPDVGCPVSLIKSLTAHPVTAGHYFVVFEAPVAAVADDVIQLEGTSGKYVNATVVAGGVSSDSRTFEVTISGTLPSCDRWLKVYSGTSLGCTAAVISYTPVDGDSTRLDLLLDRPIKADTASDAVVIKYANGSTQTATVVGTPNMLTNVWRIDIGASAFVDNVGGVVEICVTPAADASCATCFQGYTTEAQCA